MVLFWQQGYTATSLNQLLQSMAIGRSRFYGAFGDKRKLYVETLCLFAERKNAILSDVREQGNPAIAIKLFFPHTLFDVPKRKMRRGCMLVNTVLELAHTDSDLAKIAADKLAKIESAFEECFRSALHSGNLTVQQSPEQLAQFIMTVNQGLRVASRKDVGEQQLNSILNTTLSLLGMVE